MQLDHLRFTPQLLTKPPTGGIDVVTTLQHFAIISYLAEPEDLRPHIPNRFELVTLDVGNGRNQAIISVVPFLDLDFRFAKFPWLKWHFGQTNYRAYIYDPHKDEHVVWFFGTCLDSYTNVVPHYFWKLPWHNGNIRFDCAYDTKTKRYTTYQMQTKSSWAAAELELIDIGKPPQTLAGFPNLEAGLVLLTHPLRGYYNRRDGSLGSYSIWHDRLQLTEGQLVTANFPLLDRLGLVTLGNLQNVHSVLLQHSTDFTIYLPPITV